MTLNKSTLKAAALGVVAALVMVSPLAAFAGKAAVIDNPSCNSVMSKSREFSDAPRERIEGICKSNRNSPAYWACMDKRIGKGQGFADAGSQCNRLSNVTTASR